MRLVLDKNFPDQRRDGFDGIRDGKNPTGVSPASFKRACTRSPTAQTCGLFVRVARALTA